MEKIQRKLKNNEGITLIALVVTIIILLILAGVAINIALGDNGIFIRSKEAKEQHEIAEEKEAINLAMSSLKIEKTRESIMSNTEETLITPEELKAEMDKGAPKPASVEVGENEGELQVRFDERRKNRSYDVTQNGEITLKKVLTPEEASQIIDAVFDIRADKNDRSKRIPYILTAGGDVIRTTRSEENAFSKVNLTDDIVTRSGVRKKTARKKDYEESSFIDNKGKVYLYGNNIDSSIICLNDIEGSALNEKKIIDVHTVDGWEGTAIDSNGKVYIWDDRGIKSVCLNDIEGSALNEKNIVDIYDNNIAKDSNGKIYTWNYNWNNETLDLLCLNDMGGDVLKDVIIEEVYYSGNVLKDNKGKIYIFNNETSEWICINDIEGSPLNGKNIVKLYDNGMIKDSDGKIYEPSKLICINDIEGSVLKDIVIEETYYGNIIKDSNGKIYIFNNETSEWICINDIEGSPLNGKNIADVVFYEQDRSQYIKYVANDINGNVYEINYKYDNGELEVVCINDIENSELKGKKIRKIVMLDASVCYITEDNECYIYSWKLGIPV